MQSTSRPNIQIRNQATPSVATAYPARAEAGKVAYGKPMVILREVIGSDLRRRRTTQKRTLREVAASARVSVGYLSEIERGQKEPSSELLNAIYQALNTPLSEVLADLAVDVARHENAFASIISGVATDRPVGPALTVKIPAPVRPRLTSDALN